MRAPRYDRQRQDLVRHLWERGIRDERVLQAIAAVPRHAFVEPALRQRAYEDEALPIGLKQTISQPFTVAYQTALLGVEDGDKVLEIGTGSGYQAAVLCELGARVFSIERHGPLLERTEALLDRLGYRVVTRHGDGTLGWAGPGPYDGVVVTAGGAEVPEPLLQQLSPDGGRLVIPVGGRDKQTMLRITRRGDSYTQEEFADFRFVPLVPEAARR
ncbi:MAG: protein-L-isoaspartate(D-aspartate) O-methyltransferase [Rhodothermales bacterium]|nr:protein-L-isoaspartate(D-aspartate) O-methyltransferase [Rhodothermales bacterium]